MPSSSHPPRDAGSAISAMLHRAAFRITAGETPPYPIGGDRERIVLILVDIADRCQELDRTDWLEVVSGTRNPVDALAPGDLYLAAAMLTWQAESPTGDDPDEQRRVEVAATFGKRLKVIADIRAAQLLDETG